MSDPIDIIRRAIDEGGPDVLSKIADALGYTQEAMDQHAAAAVTDYWYEHYNRKHLCSLCGNSGRIDTRGARTNAGIECGAINFCICPNGQALRRVAG